ncbi:MAG: hypothetical protein JW846_03875 [Dehalococcoidia bacterium]|nr:hypothetical protein [Dehalococcoidia bacterium]
MRTGTTRGTTGGTPHKGVRLLRFALFILLLMLLTMATGCADIFADVLSGDGCGTHDVCSTKAATAGVGATLMGLAGTYLQKQEDAPSTPWPWDKDQSEFDADLDDEFNDEMDISRVKHPEEEAGGGGLDDGADDTIEDILGPGDEPEAGTTDTKPSEDGTAPWDKEDQSAGTEQDKKPEEQEVADDGTAPWDKEEQSADTGQDKTPDDDQSSEGVDKQPEEATEGSKETTKEGAETGASGDKEKPTSPAAPYVPVTTVGDVTILTDPDTGRIAVQGGKYIGGKNQDGYWITDNNKIVQYDPGTGKYTVSDGHFTATHEGSTYTVTKDNTVLVYDHVNEGLSISNGKFTAVREGTMYAVTEGNKILAFDQATGEFAVTDGHFTAKHEDTTYAVTKDNVILTYDEASGNIKVSDGQFTATREGTVYSVTQDNKILTYDRNSGNFKVSDGHYVLERDGSITAFTKDNVKIEYDKDSHGVMVTTTSGRSEVAVGASQDGQWGVDGTFKGSIDGKPTTFGVTATRYNVPETGQQGFAGGVSLEQKNFELHAQYIKESQQSGLGIDVRKDDWSVGFQKMGDTKNYNLGWRDVQLGFEEGGGRTLSTAGYTRRF